MVKAKPTFKPTQDVKRKVQDIFPVLPSYLEESDTPQKAFGKIREELVEFGNATIGTAHEVEELFDIMGACCTYLLGHCKDDLIKQGYKLYVEKHKERYGR